MEKQTIDESSSAFLKFYDERRKFEDYLITPSVLESKLPLLDDQTKIELYKYVLCEFDKPQGAVVNLQMYIDILERDEVIQTYMNEKSNAFQNKEEKSDEQIINEILASIERRKKAKKGIRGLLRKLRPYIIYR